jgi:single-stranded-DNA-specific exonuclease
MDIHSTTDLHPAIAIHLARLGITGDDALQDYLYPTLTQLPEPFQFKDMDKAVALVIAALHENRPILIWGDYDVDGITGTALLVNFFRAVGKQVHAHIPNRLTDGYGLNREKIKKFARQLGKGALLITVDCGIANHQEITVAQECGFSVIVTDHHQISTTPVTADAVINPKQIDCLFPRNDLAGVGLAFYLAAGIRSGLRDDLTYKSIGDTINLKYFLGLVTLGTIADVVPLTGVNRILCKAGLETYRTETLPGISALLEYLSIPVQDIDGESISFKMSPAINAAGRLGKAEIAFSLFTTTDLQLVAETAKSLSSCNNTRRQIGANDLENALINISKTHVEHNKCIVIKGDYHDGLLGITASRLTEMFGVPSLVCSNRAGGQLLRGSGRAPENFDLFAALSACDHLLERFGGHRAAAGFSLAEDNFELFRKHFTTQACQQFNQAPNSDEKKIRPESIELPVSEALEPDLLKALALLEPVGEANPRPHFLDTQARLISIVYFGKNNCHFRAQARGTFRNVGLIGFNLGSVIRSKDISEPCRIVYSHMRDHFNGRASWKLKVIDIW